jgi:radical SAM superfamily enzyme YgiQ (UPF0313 family)
VRFETRLDAKVRDVMTPKERLVTVREGADKNEVRELLHKLRAAFPKVAIVCGGEHFTAVPELSMEQAPIDFLVLGEGEETAVALFRALELGLDHAVIPGIVYRAADGTVQKNPRRDRIKNVDQIPWPAWEYFDIEAYSSNRLVSGIYYGKTVPILATRGCPYQCTYCSSPNMWTTRWFAREPKDVIDEIETYHKRYGATNFPFQDLTAILKRDWVVDFCNEVERRGLKITWQLPAGTRSEIIDEEVASLLVRSGCRSLNFAPESGSERTRLAPKPTRHWPGATAVSSAGMLSLLAKSARKAAPSMSPCCTRCQRRVPPLSVHSSVCVARSSRR